MNYIVVLNYNNHEDTIECLNSLKKINDSFTTVLIDNKSSDDSVIEIKNWIKNDDYFNSKNLNFILSDENNGYASGNNLGIRHALKDNSCEYIWIINNDITVTPNALSTLKKTYENAAKKYANIGFIGSKILDHYNRDIIQSAGTQKSSFISKISFEGKNKNSLVHDIEVENLSGCSIFFSSSLIKELGYIPEDYFMYYEETDWIWSASSKGYKSYISAESVVYHKNAASTGGVRSPFVIYYMTRNFIIFTRKKSKWYFQILLLPWIALRSTVKIVYLCIFERPLVKPFANGLVDGFCGVTGKKEGV